MGVAGFIGSKLLETLLKLDQRIVGLGNFATGYQHNLDEVQSLVICQQWVNFQLIQSDLRNLEDCQRAYAAVISKWLSSFLKGDAVFINGDGETSRNFTFIQNAIQANLLTATVN